MDSSARIMVAATRTCATMLVAGRTRAKPRPTATSAPAETTRINFFIELSCRRGYRSLIHGRTCLKGAASRSERSDAWARTSEPGDAAPGFGFKRGIADIARTIVRSGWPGSALPMKSTTRSHRASVGAWNAPSRRAPGFMRLMRQPPGPRWHYPARTHGTRYTSRLCQLFPKMLGLAENKAGKTTTSEISPLPASFVHYHERRLPSKCSSDHR